MTTIKVNAKENNKDEFKHKIGNWYKSNESGEFYVLTLVNDEVCLVCVSDGNTWSGTTGVYNPRNLMNDELESIGVDLFSLVKNIEITEG